MASVKALDGIKLLIQIETAPGSGTFAHDCLISLDRGISFSAEGSDSNVPDCDDPSLPSWRQTFIDSISAEINGGGMLHTTSTENFFVWLTAGTPKNVRARIDTTGADGGGYFAGAFKLTQFNVTGSRGEKITAEITMANHGAVTWTDAA